MNRAGSTAVDLSARPVAREGGWRERVVHVAEDILLPETVRVDGNQREVRGLDSLLTDDGGTTELTTSSAHGASIVIDLGRVAMGYVEIGVVGGGTAPLRVSYAQFRQFLGPDGDGIPAPFGTDAHPWSRVDVIEMSDASTVWRSPGKREARYVAIALDGPGRVEIEFVRLRQTIYPVTYDGYFLSSDELLDRAWYHSAYGGELATITEDGTPWMLTVPYDRVLFMADLHLQALAGYYHSSDFFWLVRNTIRQFGTVQNSDGSFPAAASHLVEAKPGDPGPPDGWRWPDEGPDPEVALGSVGGLSLYHDVRIDSFTAFWVAGLADHYLYTGDADFVRPWLPVARRAIAFLEGRTTADGLYYEPDDQRTDPDAAVPLVANWSPQDIAAGVDALSNAVYHDALRGLGLLEADVAGRPTAAARLERRAEQVRQALTRRLWDPDVGAVILNDRDPMHDHTGDANAGNLMFEMLDDERALAAMRFVDENLASPYGTRSSQYPDNPYRASDIEGYINSMEALGRVRYGDGAGAVDLIRRWWGHMLAHGPGTGWFAWNTDGTVDRGAWAYTPWTTALPALSEGVLGVRPTAPGYRRWKVAPQPSGLVWAQGRVPTPDGGIAVRWVHVDDTFRLTVEAPANSEGEVAVPQLGEPRAIAMDGELVWRPDRAAIGIDAMVRRDAVVFSGIRGDHTFAWSAADEAA